MGKGDGAPLTERARRRSSPRIRRRWEKSRPRSPAWRTRSHKGPAPAIRAWGRGGRRRRHLRPPLLAARRPRLTPAPAPRLAGRPDSPSRAVPMSWSSRARICAWADMVTGGSSRNGPDKISQFRSAGDDGQSRRPRSHSAPSLRGGRREEVRQRRRLACWEM